MSKAADTLAHIKAATPSGAGSERGVLQSLAVRTRTPALHSEARRLFRGEVRASELATGLAPAPWGAVSPVGTHVWVFGGHFLK